MRAVKTFKSPVRGKKPTLKEVAQHAGVSVMTVSNVVNKRFQYVGTKTRVKVERIIKELDYIPNPTSRRLRGAKEYSVGMVIADDAPAFLQDPFINELVAGISNHLSMNNYTLSLQGVSPDRFQEAAIFSMVGMDALCVVNCGSVEARRRNIEFLAKRGMPVILLQETLPIDSDDFAVINQDDFSGGHMIASHVLAKGAKKLLLMVPSMEWPAIEERKRGVLAALEQLDNGATLQIITVPDEDFTQAQAALRNHIRTHGAPDAVLGGNDRLGIACLRFLQDEGMKVPGDVMVTGFNGFESHRYTNPALTTIISSAAEMGRYAGALIIQRLQSVQFAKQITRYPVRFQLGGSA